MKRDVFGVIADPTRREILGMIVRQPLNLNAVAERFDISRPAVSKHMKVLAESGLVVIRQQGRERYCSADLRPLSEVAQWMEECRSFWGGKLDALGRFLESEEPKPKRKPAKSSRK